MPYSIVMHKEKLLVLLTLIVCGLVFWEAYHDHNLGMPSWLPPSTRGLVLHQARLPALRFPSTNFSTYFDPQGPCLFRAVYELHPPPPVSLDLPPVRAWEDIGPLPIPIASPSHWHCYVVSPCEELSVLQDEQAQLLAIREAIAQPQQTLAQLLASCPEGQKVKRWDQVVMKNGRSYLGRVVESFDRKILFLTRKTGQAPARAVTLPRAQIQQIQKARTLTDIYRTATLQIKDYDCTAWLQWARRCDHLERQLQAARATPEERLMLVGDLATFTRELFDKALAANSHKLQVYLDYADFYLYRLQYEQALRLYQRASQQELRKASLALGLAEIQERVGLWAAALNTLKPFKTAAIQLAKARLYLRLKNAAAALQACQSVLQQQPDNQNARVLQAKAYLLQGQLERAQESLSGGQLAKGLVQSQQLNLQGVLYYLQGDLAKAYTAWRQALHPQNPIPLANLTLIYLQAGKLSTARELLNLARDRMVADPSTVYVTQGFTESVARMRTTGSQEQAQLLQKARAAFQQAVVSNPRNIWACYAQAQFLQNQAQHILDTLQSSPTSLKRKRLQWQQALLMLEQARHGYRQVLQLDTHCTQALVKLGFLAITRLNHITPELLASLELTELARDDQQEAEYYFQRALNATDLPSSRRASLWSYLSLLHLASHDYVQAEQALQKALQLDAQNRLALKQMAYLRNCQGQTTQALSYLHKLGSNDAYARRAITLIQANAQQLMWQDTFSRPDAGQVHRKWEEGEHGALIFIRHHQVIFQGKNEMVEAAAFLERKIEVEHFVWFEGCISSAPADAQLGIWIHGRPSQGILWFGRDIQGRMVWAISRDATKPPQWRCLVTTQAEGSPTPYRWPAKGTVRLRIEQTDRTQGGWSLYLNNLKIASQLHFAGLQGVGMVRVGFFGFARGPDWQMIIKQARLVSTRK